MNSLAHRITERFLRTASGREPLYGHTGPDNAYMVDDYPYGARLRCRIRYWLEHNGKKGFRFVSQTEDPRNLHWNKPKASVYNMLAGCMYLDHQHHVQWDGLTEYSPAATVLEFVKDFPHADHSNLKPWAEAKIRFLKKYATGEAYFTINGVPKPTSEEDKGRSLHEMEEWEEVLKHLH